jgi:hypothetical protein
MTETSHLRHITFTHWQRMYSAFWQTQGRRRKIALGAILTLILLLQGIIHLCATSAGRPYENWDEVATFNSAHVVSGPTANNSWRYGSLDQFMNWVAIVYFDYFDDVGRNHTHLSYANHVPPSWDNPFLAFQNEAFDKETWPSWTSYDYFRGVDDRWPIFLSRQIHLAIFYVVLLAICLGTISIFDGRAIFVLSPLLLLSVAPEVYFQATQSLPNAINGLIVFGVVLFAMIYCDRQQLRYMLISVGLLAVGMNFKPDILIAVGAPGLALCLVFLQRGWRFALRAALWAAMVGLIVTIATRPSILFDPVMDLRLRYHMIKDASTGAIDTNFILVKWRSFQDFLGSNLLWTGASSGWATLVVVFSITTVFALACWKRTPKALIIAIGGVFCVVAWAVLILRGTNLPPDRYFINGLAGFLSMIGVALLFIADSGRRWRIVAQASAAALILIWGVHAVSQSKDSLAIASTYAKYEGFDPAHHRNLASLYAIYLVKTQGFEPEVLVDQHSYTDLRLFRIHGIDAKYVNMNNFDARISALDQSRKYLIVFSRATSSKVHRFVVDVPPDLQRRFEAYQTPLLTLPIIHRYPGSPQAAFSIAPVEPGDDIVISIVTPGRSPSAQEESAASPSPWGSSAASTAAAVHPPCADQDRAC